MLVGEAKELWKSFGNLLGHWVPSTILLLLCISLGTKLWHSWWVRMNTWDYHSIPVNHPSTTTLEKDWTCVDSPSKAIILGIIQHWSTPIQVLSLIMFDLAMSGSIHSSGLANTIKAQSLSMQYTFTPLYTLQEDISVHFFSKWSSQIEVAINYALKPTTVHSHFPSFCIYGLFCFYPLSQV